MFFPQHFMKQKQATQLSNSSAYNAKLRERNMFSGC